MTHRRKRTLGWLAVMIDREEVEGRWMTEVYVAYRGRGFYVGWADEKISHPDAVA